MIAVMRIRFRLLTLGLLALAGCVPRAAPRPAEPPRPTVTVPPPPPRTADWRDWPQTPGDWTYRRDAGGTVAAFGQPGMAALLTLRCDAGARRLEVSRPGTAAGPLTIRTSTTTRAVPVRPTDTTTPTVAAALAPADPLLDAIGFTRGRFVVEQAGHPPLVLPAWAEVERVTQDCRD